MWGHKISLQKCVYYMTFNIMKRVKRAQLGTHSGGICDSDLRASVETYTPKTIEMHAGGICDSDLRASVETYTPKTIEMHGFMEHVILNYSFFEMNN